MPLDPKDFKAVVFRNFDRYGIHVAVTGTTTDQIVGGLTLSRDIDKKDCYIEISKAGMPDLPPGRYEFHRIEMIGHAKWVASQGKSHIFMVLRFDTEGPKAVHSATDAVLADEAVRGGVKDDGSITITITNDPPVAATDFPLTSLPFSILP